MNSPGYMKAYLPKWKAANPEKVAEYNRRDWEKNKAKRQAKARARVDDVNAYAKAYREANREKVVAYLRDYRKKNKEAIAAKNQTPRMKAMRTQEASKRRARQRNQVCTCCSNKQRTAVFLEAQTKRLTVDHIIPLSKGGLHCVNNFQLLTLSENSSKGNRMPKEEQP